MNAPASTWHAGETALQARAGVAARMAEVGPRVLRDHMPDQHRSFFALLPFVLAGTLDEAGHPSAALLAGPPGFAHSPEPTLLRVDALPKAHDGVHLQEGAPVGLLGLQAHTGRRNRMNGHVEGIDAAGFGVRVGQSFGNCPKYIHPREALHRPAGDAARVEELAALDAPARALIAAADTFFIATAHPLARRSVDPAHGLDVSHRGGPAGFVQVRGDALLVPDYVGNSFFNTFGNLQLEPRCGLLFVDFATGERLRIAARAEILWDGPERAALPGALRVLRLQVETAVRVQGGLPLHWAEQPR